MSDSTTAVLTILVIGLLYLGRYIFKKNKYVGVNNENYIKKNRK